MDRLDFGDGAEPAHGALRYIHATPKTAGVHKGFHDPWSNYGHDERLQGDGLSEWHPAFLQLEPTLEGCARRYASDCRRYRPRAKRAAKSRWGRRLLPWHGGGTDLPLPEEWHQLAENFRRTNEARASPWNGF